LTGLWVGFFLIAASRDIFGIATFLDVVTISRGGHQGVLQAATWLSVAFVFAAFVTYLNRVSDLYARRERPVLRLAGDLQGKADADTVIAACLESSRERVDSGLSWWAGWLSDIHTSHLRYPALLYCRPSGTLSWPAAAIIMLDTAAAIEAVAPQWTPEQARSLLRSGSSCVKRLARRLGVTVPRTAVSLQGREDRPFNETVRLVVSAGLHEERGRHETWTSFQRLRSEYAPFAAAIDFRLMHDIDRAGDRDD
jgi:hypothetical protein